MRNRIEFALLGALLLFATPAFASGTLRVCSDPNNLPFSNRERAGFENRIAELIAKDLGMNIAYTWRAQQKHFLRDTLKAGKCDVVMAMPVGTDEIETTAPYYESTYVFVYRSGVKPLKSLLDPRLRSLRIGVHVIGDDSTPPMEAFAREGIVNNVRGYLIYDDYAKPNPPARLIEAVEKGDVDVAAVWGPLAGYFAKESPVKLNVTPITDTQGFQPLLFHFSIAMGVRKGDDALKRELDAAIAKNKSQIGNILRSYGVPLVKGG